MKKGWQFFVFFIAVSFNLNAQYTPEELQQRIKEVEDEAAKFPNEGITGDVHKANIGKILFSSKPIPSVTMNSNPAQYKSKFILGDLIYGRAFLAKGINQYAILLGGYVKPNYNDGTFKSYGYSLIYADGKLLMKDPIDGASPVKFAKKENGSFVTTCQVDVVKGEADGGTWKGLIAALNTLTPGIHNIKIEFWGSNMAKDYITKEPIAIGEFELEVKENTKAKMGISFESLEVGMVNKELEAKFLSVMKEYATLNGYKENYLKVRISSKDWIINRNKTSGQITSRYLRVYGYAKWPDGHCGYHVFDIFEAYNGSQYTKNYTASTVREQKACDCNP